MPGFLLNLISTVVLKSSDGMSISASHVSVLQSFPNSLAVCIHCKVKKLYFVSFRLLETDHYCYYYEV